MRRLGALSSREAGTRPPSPSREIVFSPPGRGNHRTFFPLMTLSPPFLARGSASFFLFDDSPRAFFFPFGGRGGNSPLSGEILVGRLVPFFFPLSSRFYRRRELPSSAAAPLLADAAVFSFPPRFLPWLPLSAGNK